MSEEVKKEQNEQEETLYCECCGCVIDDDDYTEWNGQIICSDCLENHTTTCECCGERIWDEDVYGDNDITLCSHCYHHSYTRCSCCDALLHEDDAYYLDGETYCRDCYEDEREENNLIHEYMATSRTPSSTVRAIVTLASNWKSTEQAETMTLRKSCWTLQTPMQTYSTSKQTARWMMVWSWSPIPALWTITSTSSRGKILCTVPFVKATARIRLQPAVCISM